MQNHEKTSDLCKRALTSSQFFWNCLEPKFHDKMYQYGMEIASLIDLGLLRVVLMHGRENRVIIKRTEWAQRTSFLYWSRDFLFHALILRVITLNLLKRRFPCHIDIIFWKIFKNFFKNCLIFVVSFHCSIECRQKLVIPKQKDCYRFFLFELPSQKINFFSAWEPTVDSAF